MLGPRHNRFRAFAQPVAVAACYMILSIFVRGFYNYAENSYERYENLKLRKVTNILRCYVTSEDSYHIFLDQPPRLQVETHRQKQAVCL